MSLAKNKAKNKVTLVALMLLAFISQVTFASVSFCQMDIDKDSTVLKHSSIVMAEQVTGTIVLEDMPNPLMSHCCDKINDCSISSCISIALPTFSIDSSVAIVAKPVETNSLLNISQIRIPLFRPPILS